MKTSLILFSAAASLCAVALPFARALEIEPRTAAPTSEQLDFFEKKIRPVLSDKCYKCHSEKSEKLRGGLMLDTREGIRRGGDNGPAVVPGDLKESLLIDAIRYSNKDTSMPPEKSGGKLPDATIADFEAWVKMGAPDPRDGAAKLVKKFDTSEAKHWWAYQAVQKPAAPQPKEAAWPKSDLDRFVLAGLEAKGIAPVADADPATFIRRVYFDLIGLPPSLREVDEFIKQCVAADGGKTGGALPNSVVEKVVDRLLASPQFGERWGRHWLDVARYAESSGKDVNTAFPYAWRYRDYVIGAFNADKPYDQFVREQIAGDLLEAKNDKQRAEQLIATGFLAIGPKGLNEQNPRQFALDVADEQIDTVSQSILGVTIACARCHDHKFDPIAQREYYGLAGIFLSTESRYGTAQGIQNRHSSELIELPAGAGEPVAKKTLSAADRAQKEKQLEDLKKEQREIFASRYNGGGNNGAQPQKPGAQPPQVRALITVTRIGFLEAELKSYDQSGQPKALAMGVRDRPAKQGSEGFGGMFRDGMRARYLGGPPPFPAITDSPLFARGDVDKPGDKVPRGFPSVLTLSTPPGIPANSSGRRELADWLVSPQNPLTARVVANRTWHWLFGRGIVESVDNFGTMGQKPSNQALLDFLASRFVENGWSFKKMIREIVLSRTYQLSSTFEPKAFAADPENTLAWRMSKRRLDAECLRDAMLEVSGQLQLTPPLASPIGLAGNGPIGGPNRFSGVTEDTIVKAGGVTRSVYLPIARDVLPDSLAAFDFAEPSLVTGARDTTNVPSQALYMLNSSFVATQAQKFAERVMAAYPAGPNGGVSANLDQRVNFAYWLVFGRPPDQVERTASAGFFSKFPSNWSKGDTSTASMRDAADVKAAWTSFCRALFAGAEFRYLN